MSILKNKIDTVRNDHYFAVEYMTEQREHFSNEQITIANYKVSFLDYILEYFGY